MSYTVPVKEVLFVMENASHMAREPSLPEAWFRCRNSCSPEEPWSGMTRVFSTCRESKVRMRDQDGHAGGGRRV
ncbi:hypothetical protein B0G75_12358 [Paraburkholderia sp. BL18I3N2]|nr:hypothetical protein B0G75_12358 [Paraburkholderia sp. BL18I3N2]